MTDQHHGEAERSASHAGPDTGHDVAPDLTPGAETAASVEAGTGRSDPLQRLRADLETVTELPLAERADVFARAHRVVTNELHALELG